jgi:hypothetical protein
MVAAALYLVGCLVVSVLGVRALMRMNARTQHLRRVAFAFMTAAALVPLMLLVGATGQALQLGLPALAETMRAAAPLSGCLYSLGTAMLLLAGARGAA